MMYSLNFRIFLASFLFMLCLGGAVHGLISSIEESPKSEIKSDIITTDDDDDSRGGRFYGNERRVRAPCPSLRTALPNGWVRLRSNNRMARFSCNDGFELIGNRYATCNRGKWNRDLPVCVSSNCPRIVPQAPLKVKKLYQGNVIDVSCAIGFNLVVNISAKASAEMNFLVPPVKKVSFPYSSLRAYCVSKSWRIDEPTSDVFAVVNRIPIVSTPVCEVYELPVEQSKQCDFERSLCGWFQDMDDDFDWQRNRLTTPSHLDMTGPTFDHTFGPTSTIGGYYLYTESSFPRNPEETARLYSPVYQHLEGTSDACFEFYYHMYGKTIGALRVYVLEKSQVLSELTPKLELIGEQGDVWQKAQVEINAFRDVDLRPFQIVIEGVLGHGHQGDLAIDDIRLTLGQNCTNYNNSLELAPDLVADIAAVNAELNTTTLAGGTSNTSTSDSNALSSTTRTTPISSSVPLVSTESSSVVSTSTSSVNKTITLQKTFAEHIKSLFKPKKTTTVSVAATNSSLNSIITGSLSSTTPFRDPPLSFTTRSPLAKSNASSTDNLGDWSKLHQQMQATTKKLSETQATLLSEYHNSTSTTTVAPQQSIPKDNEQLAPVTTDSSLLTTVPANVWATPEASNSVHDISMISQVPAGTSSLASSGEPKEGTGGKRFASHSSLSFIALLCLVVILASTLYIAYVYRPGKLNRSNLDVVVASFVRRCKGFRSGVNVDEADDAELLMMAGNQSPPGSAVDNAAFPANGDLHAYDNAHMNEGVVYLHPTNGRY